MERIPLSRQFARIAEDKERRAKRFRRSTKLVGLTVVIIASVLVAAMKILLDEHGSGVENSMDINESRLSVPSVTTAPEVAALGMVEAAQPMLPASSQTVVQEQAQKVTAAAFVKPVRTPVTVDVPAPVDVRDLTVVETYIADYIARGYRVKRARVDEIVVSAVTVGKKLDVDPLLILGIVAIESGFDPGAQSSVGAQGLMQVHTQVHADKFSDKNEGGAAFSPLANIEVGTKVLKGYIVRTGSVANALKWYVGASRLKSDGGYGKKVLLERSRLVLAAKGRVEHARQLLLKNGFGPDYWSSVKAKHLSFGFYSRLVKQYSK